MRAVPLGFSSGAISTSTSPAIRRANFAAYAIAANPPIEWPTTSGRLSLSFSMKSSMSRTWLGRL